MSSIIMNLENREVCLQFDIPPCQIAPLQADPDLTLPSPNPKSESPTNTFPLLLKG